MWTVAGRRGGWVSSLLLYLDVPTLDIYIFIADLIGSDGWVSVFYGVAFPMLLFTAATTNTRNALLKFCPRCKSETSSDRPLYFSHEIKKLETTEICFQALGAPPSCVGIPFANLDQQVCCPDIRVSRYV
jgi:hypothetical protein